jgi:hemoglobin/transferrin/lactoferrin receptor protein
VQTHFLFHPNAMKTLLTLLLVWSAFHAHAQFAESEYNKEDSTSKVSYLEEVVVAANRIPETRRTVAQQVKIISPFVIKNFNAQNTADLLQNTGVVAMQKSQQGGGSPILRGFEASRVLLIIDGVRLNNLIYRAGHLQNVITMDNNALERAEVLFGPASTLYGSDALGGAIHFFTRDPELSTSGKLNTNVGAMFRYSSVNNEKTTHTDFNIGGQRWASFTSFTYSNFGDLRMGERNNPAIGEPFGLRNQYVIRSADNQSDLLVQTHDPFVQKFSGYTQYDLLQKVVYQANDNSRHLLNLQYSTSSDIPRYDRLTDPQGAGLRFADWYYGPQERMMVAYQYKHNGLSTFADGMVATMSYQQVEESRYDRRFGNNNRNERNESVDVWGLTVDFSKTDGKSKFRYGVDGQFNTVNSVARRVNVATGEISPQSTRYPDGDNTLHTLAVFGTHTLEFNEDWALNDGLRMGGSWLRSTFIDQSFFPFPFD